MPIQALKQAKFSPPKEAVASWETWRKGLNLLLRENEIDSSELVRTTNLKLIGSGVPTKRPGSANNFLSAASSAAGGARFTLPIKDASDNRQVLALSDWGYLVKKSGATYTLLTGASWASGSTISGTQLGGNAYIVSNNREIVRYNFDTLVGFPSLAQPTGLLATNLSGASVEQSTTLSYRITTIANAGGETLATTPVSLASLPRDLSKTLIMLTWNAVSAASGDIAGYNVYRGPGGDEKWVGGVDANTTKFYDYGEASNDPFRIVPVADTTGGPKAKYVIRFQDRLILAGIDGEPTKVLISGRYPNHEKYDWYSGGGYIYIEPNSGQNITGLGIHQEKLVVFKEDSVWQVTLNQLTYGQYVILDPQYKLLTASQGCSSHHSIVPVENDLMFANRKGIYILRYEPQLTSVINANEISAKIRPYFEAITNADHIASSAIYVDKKYLLSFPNAKETIVFDRERLCFLGPWSTPFGINHWSKYIDDSGIERWLAADSTDTYVSEFSSSYSDDKNTAIQTILKTKKEDFKDWTLFKTLNEIYMNFRSLSGSINVNVYIEDRTGKTIVTKTFTITSSGGTGTAGFGTDMFGNVQFGLTNNKPDPSEDQLTKKSFIYKTCRMFQIEVRGVNKPDNYELLGIKAVAVPQSRGNSPSTWNI